MILWKFQLKFELHLNENMTEVISLRDEVKVFYFEIPELLGGCCVDDVMSTNQPIRESALLCRHRCSGWIQTV